MMPFWTREPGDRGGARDVSRETCVRGRGEGRKTGAINAPISDKSRASNEREQGRSDERKRTCEEREREVRERLC